MKKKILVGGVMVLMGAGVVTANGLDGNWMDSEFPDLEIPRGRIDVVRPERPEVPGRGEIIRPVKPGRPEVPGRGRIGFPEEPS